MQDMRSPTSSALWVISVLFVTFWVCHHSQIIEGVNCMLFDYEQGHGAGFLRLLFLQSIGISHVFSRGQALCKRWGKNANVSKGACGGGFVFLQAPLGGAV